MRLPPPPSGLECSNELAHEFVDVVLDVADVIGGEAVVGRHRAANSVLGFAPAGNGIT